MNLFQRIALAKLAKAQAKPTGSRAADDLNKLERNTFDKLEKRVVGKPQVARPWLLNFHKN